MMDEQFRIWLGRITEMFMRYGIRSVTMDDISRELGISKKTLYQFVSSKDELVELMVLQHIEEEKKQGLCITAESANAIEEMLRVTELVITDAQQMKTNIVFDLQRYYNAAWRHVEAYQHEHMTTKVRQNLERGVAEGLYRNDFDVGLAARLHAAASFSLFDDRWFPRSEFPPDKVIREFFLHYLYGLVSDKGRALLKEKISQSL